MVENIEERIKSYSKKAKHLKDKNFVKRLFMLNIPDIYLEIFTINDSTLADKELWKKINNSNIRQPILWKDEKFDNKLSHVKNSLDVNINSAYNNLFPPKYKISLPDEEGIFNLASLKNLFYKTIGQYNVKNFSLPNALDEFEKKSKDILKNSLNKQWNLEILPSFIGGFTFKKTLIKKKDLYEKTQIPQTYNRSQRSINEADIKKSIIEIIEFVEDLIKEIKKIVEKQKFEENAPIAWLEFIQSNNENLWKELKVESKNIYEPSVLSKAYMYPIVPEEIRQKIMLNYFNLDEEKAKRGIELDNRLSLKELAAKLKLSEDNAITHALKNSYGIYIKEDSYNVSCYNGRMSILDIISQLESAYKYTHRGHLRLVKKHDFWGRDFTAEKLYSGNIENLDRDFFILPAQISISEACLGLSGPKHIKLERGQKITRDDLVFFEDEIESALNNDDNLMTIEESEKIERSSSKNTFKKVKIAIFEIIKLCKNKNLTVVENKLPPTKKRWLTLIKKVDKTITIEVGTFEGYFKKSKQKNPLPFKFTTNSKTSKELIDKIEKIILV